MKSLWFHVAATPKTPEVLMKLEVIPLLVDARQLYPPEKCHPEVNQVQQVLKQTHKNGKKGPRTALTLSKISDNKI